MKELACEEFVDAFLDGLFQALLSQQCGCPVCSVLRSEMKAIFNLLILGNLGAGNANPFLN